MELRDPATMTAEERLSAVEQYRRRMLDGEELSVEELNHAVSCIAADRSTAMRERKATSAAARKASNTIAPLSVDDL